MLDAISNNLANKFGETIIFQDKFDTLNFDTWQHEITMSGGGNWEFEMYVNDKRNAFVKNNTLFNLRDKINGKIIVSISDKSPVVVMDFEDHWFKVKYQELIGKSISELYDSLILLKKELLGLRIQKSMSKLQNTAQIRKSKKDVARIMTRLNQLNNLKGSL